MYVFSGLSSVYRARALLIRSNFTRFQNTWTKPRRRMSRPSGKWRSRTSSISNCYLQVLGTGGGELKPSLFLFTDSKRYLFNCVENVQRFCNEHRIRQTKLGQFFFTRISCDNVGGLSGQLLHFLNFFEVHKLRSVHLHGPESLSSLIHSSRFHIHSDKIGLNINDPIEEYHGHNIPVYRDENMTVYTLNISLLNSHSKSPSSDESGDDEGRAPPAKRLKLARENANSVSVFICKLVDVPGKFNPEKAKELGLRPGPSYRALVNGESVTLPQSRIIHPSDVVGPVRVGPTLIVVECPHPLFIEPITSHPLLQKKLLEESEKNVALIAHLSPRAVVENEEYSKWMASFGSETKHLLLHKTVCPPDWTLRKLLKSHAPMHHLNSSVFRNYAELPTVDNFPEKLLNVLPRENIIIGNTLLKYNLKPVDKAGIDESESLEPFSSYWEGLVTNIHSSRDYSKALTKLPRGEKEESITSPSKSLPANDRVTFLGTGASSPSSFRNVSAILLHTAGAGNIIFDCGEGTLSQLYRHFGPTEGDRVMEDLRTIFISHSHGDHNLGVVSLLRRRAELMQRRAQTSGDPVEQTTIVGPNRIGLWLRDYDKMCEKLFFNFIISADLTKNEMPIGLGEDSVNLMTVPVNHIPEACAAVVSRGEGWKVVYSGDTRPCRGLVEAGKGATLLIHEATLEDSYQEEARQKRHCTISEALQVAEDMDPEFTILTHFSQRYSRFLPVILNRRNKLKSKVFPAFDHFTVALSDLHKLPGLLPSVEHVLAYMSSSEDDDDEPSTSFSWS